MFRQVPVVLGSHDAIILLELDFRQHDSNLLSAIAFFSSTITLYEQANGHDQGSKSDQERTLAVSKDHIQVTKS